MSGPLVVIGDSLLDRDLVGTSQRQVPDTPVPVIEDLGERDRAGGAALAALLAVGEGREVVLVTALADDAGGARIAEVLRSGGVEVRAARLHGSTPQKVRVWAGRHLVARLDYGGGAERHGPLPAAAGRAVAGASGILVSDYGHGMSTHPGIRVDDLGGPRRPLVWDPHPRGGRPVAGTWLATPNQPEAGVQPRAGLNEVTARARQLRDEWRARAVAITLGERGALLVDSDDTPLAVPAAASHGDACGAGDRFAAAAAGALAGGALLSEAVQHAVGSASSFVAAGGARGLDDPDVPGGPPSRDPVEVARRVRAAGGTVVATGGCFDLVHAGHVRFLESARQLGDCLIVCLNSDASVRRIKGPARPIQEQGDRAAVLLALGCVDAVAVFDEDWPAQMLARLRPHVFAKGADYTLARLPEADVVAGWGGQAVLLPYLEGRSTTHLVKEAARRA